MSGTTAIPGDVIGKLNEFECGIGCYSSGSNIISSIFGQIVHDPPSNNLRKLNVISNLFHSKEAVIEAGDVILARVVKLTVNQAFLDIISVLAATPYKKKLPTTPPYSTKKRKFLTYLL